MKIICIGRNYVDHAKELNNPVPTKPLVFMKPSSALLINNKPLYYPEFTKSLHYEAEIVLKMAKNGKHVEKGFAPKYVTEIGIGIDFTARDVQSELKKKGHPWEIAKGFDGSAAMSPFIPISTVDRNAVEFKLTKNKATVQTGNTKDLIFSFEHIICYVSKFFKLNIGDLIYTGTPAGVGEVAIGDVLEGFIMQNGEYNDEAPLLYCEVK